jgi:serine/threonine protein kinase
MSTTEQRNALSAGSVVQHYRIERLLGAGGFGITYLAVEQGTERQVALKEFLPSGIALRDSNTSRVHPVSDRLQADFDWGLERFRAEAQVLIEIRHPNVVPVLSFFEANGTAYMAMEFQEGISLGAAVPSGDTLEQSELDEIIPPLLDGVEAVHAAGFLHRDIKPDNIFIRKDGSPVLLDFGSARQAMTEHSLSLTAVVSSGYAPHEQYHGRGQGPWTDIYALGALLYRLMSGVRPIDGPARLAAAAKGEEDPLPSIREVGEGRYRDSVLRAAEHALGVFEKDRPQSIAEFRAVYAGSAEPAVREAAQTAPAQTEPARPEPLEDALVGGAA